MSLQAIISDAAGVRVLDQLLLPGTSKYVDVTKAQDAWACIREMKVRGAPAIAIVAALSLAPELASQSFTAVGELKEHFLKTTAYLRTSRPTAVNLFTCMDQFDALVHALVNEGKSCAEIIQRVREEADGMLVKDVQDNTAVGRFGAEAILARSAGQAVRVLTHCNTGSLATGGYGTALGIVRSLAAAGKLDHVYFTETRPYNQGARLTAYELVHDRLPCTMVADSMAALLMERRGIGAVVVGADRVVRNGDTANKIGTYMLALCARHHGVPFFVAAPSTSIDTSRATGEEIHIEERPAEELLVTNGVRATPVGLHAWNPSFDVTPAALIAGIVTEFGVASPGDDGSYDMAAFLAKHRK